jgi:hypothetical protein
MITVTSIEPPINGGDVWSGTAESTGGDHYTWTASLEYWKPGHGCFRQSRQQPEFWQQVPASRALYRAVRAAIRAAAH